MSDRDSTTMMANPMDLAKIRWYVNEIENWAYSIYAKGGAASMREIEGCLVGAYECMKNGAKSELTAELECHIGWKKCPDGSCRPRC